MIIFFIYHRNIYIVVGKKLLLRVEGGLLESFTNGDSAAIPVGGVHDVQEATSNLLTVDEDSTNILTVRGGDDVVVLLIRQVVHSVVLVVSQHWSPDDYYNQT